MRSLSFISLIFILYSTAIFAVPSRDQLKKDLGLENTIVFSHVVAKDTPKGKGAEQLKELVKNSKGLDNVPEIQVYPDSVLFDDNKVMQALADNKVQLAAPSISKLLTINSKLKIFDFPFLFLTVDDVSKFYEAAREKLFVSEKVGNSTFWYLDKDKNYLVLGLWHGGMKQITSDKEVIVSIDKLLEGLKFRIQSSPVIELTFSSLGAEPKPEDNFAKVLKMLKTKKINGQENTWSNIVTGKFYEEQTYFLETNHSYLGYLLITNQSFLKKHLENPENGKKWQVIFEQVTRNVNQSTDNADARTSLESILRKRAKAQQSPAQEKSDELIKPFEAKVREEWCEKIYRTRYSDWKNLVDEVGKEIVQLAIDGKKGDQCPYNHLTKLIK